MEATDFEAWIAEYIKAEKEKRVIYWPNRERSIKQRDRIRAHSDFEYYPESLFKERAPNQTPEQQKYIRANFKQTTNPIWQDLLSIVQKGFIDRNWFIIWPDGSEGLKKYTTEDMPMFGSVETFVKQVAAPLSLQDANGIITVRPYRFNLIQREDGAVVIDDREDFEPAPFYHSSEQIVHMTENLLVALDNERSAVKDGNVVKMEGRVFYAYTPTHIIKAIQVGKKSDHTFKVAYSFEHGEGILPIRQLKGVPIIGTDGKILWISPFFYAVGSLDLALVNENWLQAMLANCAFPFRIVRMEACDFADSHGVCRNGMLIDLENGAAKGDCPACRGSGKRVPISPLGEYQWAEKDGIGESGKGPSYKPVEYVEPGDVSMRMVSETVAINKQNARAMLHLTTSNSQVKGAENMTATGMAIDLSGQHSFIKGIIDNLFDLFGWTNKRISWQRYSSYDQVPTIIPPQTYDFRTEADIWEQIKTARDAGAPTYIIQKLYSDLLNTVLATDPKAASAYETVVAADLIFALPSSDIAARVANQSIEPWRVTLHDSAHQLIMQLANEDSTYFNLPLLDRVTKLHDLAKSRTFVATTSSVDRINQLLTSGV